MPFAISPESRSSSPGIPFALLRIPQREGSIFSLEFLDLLHVFSPHHEPGLLCFESLGRSVDPLKRWGIVNRHYGDFCTGADRPNPLSYHAPEPDSHSTQ